ncbi:hypothetical protein KBC79_01495 [Candidatus Woesebacteria bacterium]|nr:hypothetical protein [Candidatus Woesebacteria bacterium]
MDVYQAVLNFSMILFALSSPGLAVWSAIGIAKDIERRKKHKLFVERHKNGTMKRLQYK